MDLCLSSGEMGGGEPTQVDPLERAGLYCYTFIAKVKVKQSRYRPGVAQRVPGSLRFPDYITTAQDGGRVVSPTRRLPLPPGNTPGTHFC